MSRVQMFQILTLISKLAFGIVILSYKHNSQDKPSPEA